jgi:dihydrofolate reductase
LDIALVAALDRRSAIGRGNALPWHLPDDLRRFKALTLGHAVLMGRKTAEAIGRPLPGRRNLVLTRRARAPVEGMEAVASLDAAEAAAGDGPLMVIGGGEVYALALPRATHLYLTHVDTLVDDADTFFPELDASRWTITARTLHPADARHAVAFEDIDYERRDARVPR